MPDLTNYPQRFILRCAVYVSVVAVASIILVPAVAGSEGSSAQADVIDPFTYLQSNYTYQQAIPDPQAGAWGDIVGADAINNGTGFVIVYDVGNVSFWNDADVIASDPYKSIPVRGTPTGISEILDSYGGRLAISDSSGIDFFDLDGNYNGRRGTTLSNIRDITYDVERDRIILSTQLGTKILNPDGSGTHLIANSNYAAEVINLVEDESGNPIDDLFQSNNAFYRMLSDGSLPGFFDTDLGTAGGTLQGIAYTQKHAIMALEGGLLVYDKLAFQDYMDYNVPEPGTLALLSAGGFLLSLSKGRKNRGQI